MKFSFKALLLLFFLLLLSCSTSEELPAEEPIAEAPMDLRSAVDGLPFCEADDHVLFRSFFQAQGSEPAFYDICVSEQKVEFRSETVSAGTVVSYLQQQYYLPELSFEDFLAQVKAFGLMNTEEEVDYSSFGTCQGGQIVTIQGEEIEEFRRDEPCSGNEEPLWITSVEGDFDGLAELMKEQVPGLDSLLKIDDRMPYPGSTEIYRNET